eukprot:3583798-Prymnesium_polylepis.1
MRHGLVVGCEASGIGVFGRRTRSKVALLAPAALARGRDAAAELGPPCGGSDRMAFLQLEFGAQGVLRSAHPRAGDRCRTSGSRRATRRCGPARAECKIASIDSQSRSPPTGRPCCCTRRRPRPR